MDVHSCITFNESSVDDALQNLPTSFVIWLIDKQTMFSEWFFCGNTFETQLLYTSNWLIARCNKLQ